MFQTHSNPSLYFGYVHDKVKKMVTDTFLGWYHHDFSDVYRPIQRAGIVNQTSMIVTLY